jgi:predicted transcriptional regulator
MNNRILRVDRAGTPTGLGPLEARVMDAAWSLCDWVSVSDVSAALQYKRGEKPLAYSTVKAVLSNLVEKRHLRKRALGKANIFRPVKTRETFQADLISNVVGPLLRAQRNPLLAHIAGELAIDDASYAEFERLLAEKRAQRTDA